MGFAVSDSCCTLKCTLIGSIEVIDVLIFLVRTKIQEGVARFEGTLSSDIRTLSMWLYTVDGVATGASVVPAVPVVFALGCLHRFRIANRQYL